MLPALDTGPGTCICDDAGEAMEGTEDVEAADEEEAAAEDEGDVKDSEELSTLSPGFVFCEEYGNMLCNTPPRPPSDCSE